MRTFEQNKTDYKCLDDNVLMKNNLNSNIEKKIIDISSNFKIKHNIPVIVEVSGTPNSGKTSTTQTIEKLLKRSDSRLKVKIIGEAANRCKIKDKLSPDFNQWTASETIKLLTEVVYNDYDLVICERGIFDALCWIQFHFNDGRISKREFDAMSSYFSLQTYVDKIGILIVMKCGVDTSISRENMHGIVDTKGTIVNEEVLMKLNSAIEQTYLKYKNFFADSLILDTTDLTPTCINKEFLDILLSRLT